jgi:lysophospholipase L1-like esterase
MKELAKEENVQVLDLHKKTLEEFSKYSDEELRKNFGDCTLNNGYIDRTHYEPKGADKVAQYIKELACEMNNPALCTLFK